MNCKHVQKSLLSANELDSDAREHIESCAACTKVSEEQALVSRSLEMVAAAEPPIGSAERAFRAAMSGDSVVSSPSFLDRLLPIATPFAAGATAAAVIALLLGSPDVRPDEAASTDTVADSLLSEDAGDDDGLGELLALGDD